MENFGINISLKHRNKKDLDRYVELLKKIGVSWVRLEFDFYNKDPEFIKSFDYLIEKLSKNNIKMLGVLAGIVTGGLASVLSTFVPDFITRLFSELLKYKNPYDEIEKYKLFVKNLCTRYKDYINHWQIWNEANLTRFWIRDANADEYFELVKASAPIIKEINSKNKILSSAVCGDDVNFTWFGFKTNFLSRLIELGLNDYVDIIAFHPYVASNYIGFVDKNTLYKGLMARINVFLDKFSKYGKEIWITELGISKYTGLHIPRKDENIAEIYTRIMDYTIKEKNIKTFLWVLTDFNDENYLWYNPEKHFGLVDYNLNEKILFKKIQEYTTNITASNTII